MKLWTTIFILTCLTLLGFSCKSEQKASDLVQPAKWWSVHPRPVYTTLEKVGTYQEWFDVYRLTEDTFAIYEPNQFEEALCYLLLGQEKAAVIDTGTGIGNIRAVAEELTELPVEVVLTHEHYDHVAGAWRFEDVIHYDNKEALNVLAAGRNNDSLQKYVTPYYLWKPLPEGFDPTTWTIPPLRPTRLVKEGDIIDLGGRTLEVIYTPGHSPGQMCLLDAKNRILFTGDHFFPGPLYAHAADVNMADYIASNQKLIARLEEFDHICAGHNDPWVKSEVIPRISRAFADIYQGKGTYSEADGLRRYSFEGFDVLINKETLEKGMDGYPPLDANLVFFYYKDLSAAKSFHSDILGLEKILDYGFAAIYRISPTTFIGLVDETQGMHRASEPKTVTLSFVTGEIDAWYEYLKSKDVPMRGAVRNATRHATRGFVAYDPEGYFLEFETFLDDEENAALHTALEGKTALYPPPNTTSQRPADLGIQANVIWFYYKSLEEAQKFYEEKLGARLLVDQGFAKVYSSSPTGFIGLVDEAEGLHRFSENKAVTVSFISEEIDDWYIHLWKKGLAFVDHLQNMSSIPVRVFVTSDPAGYTLEFDRFLEDEVNEKILLLLKQE
ncbi:MAG: MBL fold metallo-hydrolase [Candidatus Aminicenantes bacterium]|nr:MBL fold metallo-hydrolase [Candidatus Aminicenantes bacterium]